MDEAEHARRLEQVKRTAFGPDPAEKQVILLKLVDLLENLPAFPATYNMDAESAHRQWLSKARALLTRLDPVHWGVEFDIKLRSLSFSWQTGRHDIVATVADAAEQIKLDLELEGRDEIGEAYSAGDIYRFFADLRSIISSASKSILVVDPYFTGNAFDEYLSGQARTVQSDILTSRYGQDVRKYLDRFESQFGVKVGLRVSKEIHDRIVILDSEECWVVGGSIKDAGKRPTYLVPLLPRIAAKKIGIYNEIWDRARPA